MNENKSEPQAPEKQAAASNLRGGKSGGGGRGAGGGRGQSNGGNLDKDRGNKTSIKFLAEKKSINTASFFFLFNNHIEVTKSRIFYQSINGHTSNDRCIALEKIS